MIKVSENAKSEVGKLLGEEGRGPNHFVRVGVKGGGCSGLMYDLTFDRLYRGTTFQGGKYCDWMIRRSQLITPLLSRRTGRPVRCEPA